MIQEVIKKLSDRIDLEAKEINFVFKLYSFINILDFLVSSTAHRETCDKIFKALC